MSLLEMSTRTWHGLIEDLRIKGRGKRESGAFLLGTIDSVGHARRVSTWVSYEQLDPNCARFAYIRLDSDAFPRLWDYCTSHDLQVVADVHTHPWGPRQSASDRAHPMVSMAGHIALIVPNFAYGDIAPADVSVNVYQGDSQWSSHYGRHATSKICLTPEHSS